MSIYYFSELVKRNKKSLKAVCSLRDILYTSRKSAHDHCPEHLQYKPFSPQKSSNGSDQAIVELRKRLNNRE